MISSPPLPPPPPSTPTTRVLIVGEKGSGKSFLGNLLLQRHEFHLSFEVKTAPLVLTTSDKESNDQQQQTTFLIYDLPPLCDSASNRVIEEVFIYSHLPTIILFVFDMSTCGRIRERDCDAWFRLKKFLDIENNEQYANSIGIIFNRMIMRDFYSLDEFKRFDREAFGKYYKAVVKITRRICREEGTNRNAKCISDEYSFVSNLSQANCANFSSPIMIQTRQVVLRTVRALIPQKIFPAGKYKYAKLSCFQRLVPRPSPWWTPQQVVAFHRHMQQDNVELLRDELYHIWQQHRESWYWYYDYKSFCQREYNSVSKEVDELIRQFKNAVHRGFY